MLIVVRNPPAEVVERTVVVCKISVLSTKLVYVCLTVELLPNAV